MRFAFAEGGVRAPRAEDVCFIARCRHARTALLVVSTAVLGACACAVSLFGCTLKNDRQLKLTVMAAMCLWTPYYWLVGGHTGAVFAALVGLRQGLLLNAHRMSRGVQDALLVVFLVAMSATVATTWGGWISLLPWLATVNSTYAYRFTGGVRLRLHLAGCDAAWALYAVLTSAWSYLALTAVTFTLSLWTAQRIWRGTRAASTAGLERAASGASAALPLP